MAVKKFLMNVDFVQNQLLQPVIEVLASAPGTPVEGQIYYNSTGETLWLRQNSTWLDLGVQGGATALSIGTQTGTTLGITSDGGVDDVVLPQVIAAGNAGLMSGADKTKLDAISGTNSGDVTLTNSPGTYDYLTISGQAITLAQINLTTDITGNLPVTNLNSGTSASGATFWRGDGTWATPAGGFTNFDASSDNGTDQTVNSLDVLEITGGTGISTTISKVSTTVTIDVDLDDTAVSPAAYGSATQYVDITIDQQGRITSASEGNISIPLSQVNDVTATASEVNLLDLAGLTAGWVLAADTATTASWQQISGSDINNDLSWATETYVDNAVTGALNYQGGYNAATNTPDLDTSPSGILEGYTYTVTAAGTFFSTGVQIGDMLIAENDAPTTEGEWTIVNKNIPDIVSASETAEGIIELATQAEVNTGTDTTRAVTPATLTGVLGTTGTLSTTLKYTETIGNGALTTIVVTHNIGEQHVHSQVFEVADGMTEVECEVENTSTTTTTFKFNTAPTTDQYRVVIIG